MTTVLKNRAVLLANSSSFLVLSLTTTGRSNFEIRQSGLLDHSLFEELHAAFSNLKKYSRRVTYNPSIVYFSDISHPFAVCSFAFSILSMNSQDIT